MCVCMCIRERERERESESESVANREMKEREGKKTFEGPWSRPLIRNLIIIILIILIIINSNTDYINNAIIITSAGENS